MKLFLITEIKSGDGNVSNLSFQKWMSTGAVKKSGDSPAGSAVKTNEN
jgi:hypothetical protein